MILGTGWHDSVRNTKVAAKTNLTSRISSLNEGMHYFVTQHDYTVSRKKLSKIIFCHVFIKFPPTLIIFTA